jgi:hypothetical protein
MGSGGGVAVLLLLLPATEYLLCSWMVPAARWLTRWRTTELVCAKRSWHILLWLASDAMASATAACTRMGGSFNVAA